MQFVIIGRDGKDALEKRMRVRASHLENSAKVKEYGSIVCAGGLLDDEGKMIGSVMIMDFASEELLDRYLASEPYISEKVWESVTVERMNVVIMNDEKIGK